MKAPICNDCCAQIDAVTKDVLIVSEEFAEFAGARRGIDLLGVDREGKPVVIELKRTTDGEHLEFRAGECQGIGSVADLVTLF